MRLLDLFCGAGGAAMGYHRAGFEVVGVDIAEQPHYPFTFHRMDALQALRMLVGGGMGFDAIHASPPCQASSALRVMPNARAHVDLIAPTRHLLQRAGLPYVIENVVGAALVAPVRLCGASFGLQADGRDLARHRLFECSFPVVAPPCAHRSRRVIGIYGDHARKERRHHNGRSQYNAADSLRYGRQAMGVDWMEWHELAQAIPPAYTEHIGHYLMAEINARRKEAA